MEIHLANRLGVSRTPIREAIRMLELEGLVTMIPRRGAEVAQITEKGLKDVLEVRQALDALAIELACERITEEEIRELRRACDTFVQMTRTQDAVRIAQADVALHDIIVRASGNDRLIQMVGNLSQQMYRYRLEYIKDVSQHGRLIEEHEEIYRCIRSRMGKPERERSGCTFTIRNSPFCPRFSRKGRNLVPEMYKAVRVVNTFRRTERRTVCRRNGNGCAACPGISDRDYVDGFRYAEKKLLLHLPRQRSCCSASGAFSTRNSHFLPMSAAGRTGVLRRRRIMRKF